MLETLKLLSEALNIPTFTQSPERLFPCPSQNLYQVLSWDVEFVARIFCAGNFRWEFSLLQKVSQK